ncbi:serpin B6-like [Elephas maximus indicus]|uniref:serpin B6-like n=1 Tax=Elephas maximus indicus TaxID=99487 RepID=UPI00211674C2|nr:serpin B6-like [Elephas maximus indicus]
MAHTVVEAGTPQILRSAWRLLLIHISKGAGKPEIARSGSSQHTLVFTSYVDEVHTQGLELPCMGWEPSMVILLPDDDMDLSRVESMLTYDNFSAWTKPRVRDNEGVEVSLPSFKLEENYNLESVLGSLGITNAFDKAKADFSGMSFKRDLSLSKCVPRFLVDINEEGTKVATVAKCTSLMPRFNAGHPFLSFIQHNRAEVFSCGRFSSP